MEAVLMNSTGDYKHRIGNPKRNFGSNRTLFPYPSDDLLFLSSLAGARFDGGGLLSMPPSYSSLPHSYLPAVSGFLPPQNLHQYRQQPPLLPLPNSLPVNHRNINLSRSNSTTNNNIRLSSTQINKNTKTRGRDHSITPKKSKNQKKNLKKEEADLRRPATTEEKEAPPAPPAVSRLNESSIEPITGPDLKDLPKEVNSRVFSSSINKSCDTVSFHFDNFSGPVSFTPSPPPSSLPLPNFLLRSKLSCKAEASAGTTASEDGATDNLRRLLRL